MDGYEEDDEFAEDDEEYVEEDEEDEEDNDDAVMDGNDESKDKGGPERRKVTLKELSVVEDSTLQDSMCASTSSRAGHGIVKGVSKQRIGSSTSVSVISMESKLRVKERGVWNESGSQARKCDKNYRLRAQLGEKPVDYWLDYDGALDSLHTEADNGQRMGWAKLALSDDGVLINKQIIKNNEDSDFAELETVSLNQLISVGKKQKSLPVFLSGKEKIKVDRSPSISNVNICDFNSALKANHENAFDNAKIASTLSSYSKSSPNAALQTSPKVESPNSSVGKAIMWPEGKFDSVSKDWNQPSENISSDTSRNMEPLLPINVAEAKEKSLVEKNNAYSEVLLCNLALKSEFVERVVYTASDNTVETDTRDTAQGKKGMYDTSSAVSNTSETYVMKDHSCKASDIGKTNAGCFNIYAKASTADKMHAVKEETHQISSTQDTHAYEASSVTEEPTFNSELEEVLTMDLSQESGGGSNFVDKAQGDLPKLVELGLPHAHTRKQGNETQKITTSHARKFPDPEQVDCGNCLNKSLETSSKGERYYTSCFKSRSMRDTSLDNQQSIAQHDSMAVERRKNCPGIQVSPSKSFKQNAFDEVLTFNPFENMESLSNPSTVMCPRDQEILSNALQHERSKQNEPFKSSSADRLLQESCNSCEKHGSAKKAGRTFMHSKSLTVLSKVQSDDSATESSGEFSLSCSALPQIRLHGKNLFCKSLAASFTETLPERTLSDTSASNKHPSIIVIKRPQEMLLNDKSEEKKCRHTSWEAPFESLSKTMIYKKQHGCPGLDLQRAKQLQVCLVPSSTCALNQTSLETRENLTDKSMHLTGGEILSQNEALVENPEYACIGGSYGKIKGGLVSIAQGEIQTGCVEQLQNQTAASECEVNLRDDSEETLSLDKKSAEGITDNIHYVFTSLPSKEIFEKQISMSPQLEESQEFEAWDKQFSNSGEEQYKHSTGQSPLDDTFTQKGEEGSSEPSKRPKQSMISWQTGKVNGNRFHIDNCSTDLYHSLNQNINSELKQHLQQKFSHTNNIQSNCFEIQYKNLDQPQYIVGLPEIENHPGSPSTICNKAKPIKPQKAPHGHPSGAMMRLVDEKKNLSTEDEKAMLLGCEAQSPSFAIARFENDTTGSQMFNNSRPLNKLCPTHRPKKPAEQHVEKKTWRTVYCFGHPFRKSSCPDKTRPR